MAPQAKDNLHAKLAAGQLTLDEWDARRTEDGRVSVIDVIADVTGKNYQYATNVYNRLCKEQRVSRCEIRPLPPRLGTPKSCPQRIGRGGARVDQETPVATAAEMVEILWQLPGTAEFRRNSARTVVRFLGGDETLVDEIRQNRAAQERLAHSDPSHAARVFGEAVEAEARAASCNATAESLAELPEERAQKVRRLRLENDQREVQLVTSITQALTAIGEELDDAQRWAARDRMNNVLRGDGSGSQQETTQASIFLANKGMSATHVKELRKLFGTIAARRKRTRDGLQPNAELPTKVKEVDGHAVPVIIYKVPQDMDILEAAYQELLCSAKYAEVVGAPRQSQWSNQQRLNFARAWSPSNR